MEAEISRLPHLEKWVVDIIYRPDQSGYLISRKSLGCVFRAFDLIHCRHRGIVHCAGISDSRPLVSAQFQSG